MSKLDTVSDEIATWLNNDCADAGFDRAYIFGSLVNDDAEFFIPSGITRSDIDVLLRFDPWKRDALDRIKALKIARTNIKNLEVNLCRALELTRADEPVLSVLPITWYEICHSVHKGLDPKIFSLNIFYDAFAKRPRDTPMTTHVDFTFHLENIEAFAVMKTCQKFRNEYLKVPVNGIAKLNSWTKLDEIPKELMRASALLNYADKKASNPKKDEEPDPELRTRLLDGLSFLVSLLKARHDDDAVFADTLEIIEKRRFNRLSKSERPALTAEHLIVISETLFDHARNLPIRTVRETIDQYIRTRSGKPLYP